MTFARVFQVLFVLFVTAVSVNQAQAASPVTATQVLTPDSIGVGGASQLTIMITNNSTTTVADDVTISKTLPGAVALVGTGSTTCPRGTLNAVSGGHTILLDDAQLPPTASCTVDLTVTGTIVGTHDILATTVTTTLGDGIAAAVSLTITDEVTFQKSIVPASPEVAQEFTVTYDIMNNSGGSISFPSFSEAFPSGLLVATPSNATSDCPLPNLTTTSNSINFLSQSLLANGASCSVSVDLVSTSPGFYTLQSSDLLYNSGTSIAGSIATVDVQPLPGTSLVMSKAFSASQVNAGQTVDLEFTLRNSSRDTISDIGFTDDLNAMITGLASTTGPQANACGAGSTVSGSSTLTLSDGVLASGEFCTFTVSLLVPVATATSTYTNTTSDVTGTTGGFPVTDSPATDKLKVLGADGAVPTLTKTYLTNPSPAGVETLIEFTVQNESTINAATDIAFSDVLSSPQAMTVSALPAAGSCGAGSTFSSSFTVADETFNMNGGNLPASGSCTFTVGVTPKAGTAPGDYLNTTSDISATVNAAFVSGPGAMDTLTVQGGANLNLGKRFSAENAVSGGTIDLLFTISSAEESVDTATAIAFTDDLAAFHGGTTLASALANDCGGTVGGVGTGTFGYTGGSVAPGGSCEINVRLTLGPATGTFTNTTSGLTATANGVPTTAAAASDTLVISAFEPLELTLEVTDDPVAPGGAATLQFTLRNDNVAGDATLALFSIDLYDAITGLESNSGTQNDICGSGSSISGTRNLSFTGNLLAGASCTFSVNLDVPGGAGAGSHTISTESQFAVIGGSLIPQSPAATKIVVQIPELTLTKEFIDDPVVRGGTATLEFTIDNLNDSAASAIAFTDDLDAMLTGATASGLPIAACGGTVSGTDLIDFSGGAVAANSDCSFQVTVNVPATAAATDHLNETSEISGTVGGVAATGNIARDSLTVLNAARPRFEQAFNPTATVAGGTTQLIFEIENNDLTTGLTDLRFTEDLAGALTGASSTSGTQNDICGSGSTLSGTTSLSLTGGNIPAGGSCTFSVTVAVPGAAVPDTYDFTTSALISGIQSIADPALAQLVIVPPPTFAKAFSPNAIAIGATSTLTFTIDNSASALAATALDFTDNLPAGLTVATPANASTTCTGGTLTAVGGTTSIAYSGGTVASAASCTVEVAIQPTAVGSHVNTSGDLTSSSGNSGTAEDTLVVAPAPIPTIAAVFDPVNVVQGAESVLMLNIDNSAALVAANDLALSLTLPAGLTIAPAPGLSTSCGPVSAPAGGTGVALAAGQVAAMDTCTIAVSVLTSTVGTFNLTTGDLTSDLGNSGPATASLDVLSAPVPTLSAGFSPATILTRGVSTLSITLDNSAALVAATSVSLTANLPADVAIATPSSLTSDCGGVASAVAGGASLDLSGGTIAALGMCTISVDVTSDVVGTYNASVGAATTSLGTTGSASPQLVVEQAPEGTLTIVQITDTDGTFDFSSATPELNFSIVTVGGSGQFGPEFIPAGTHVISQMAPQGIGNTAITCSDSDSTGKPVKGEVTVILSAAEDVTCTITSIASAQKTVDTINKFLKSRGNLIPSSEPGSGRRLARLNRGFEGATQLRYSNGDLGALVPFTFDPLSLGSGQYQFSSSWRQMRETAASLALAHGDYDGVAYVDNQRWDVWIEGQYKRFEAESDDSGFFAIGYLGADYLVSPDLLVGVLLQVDDMRMVGDDSTVSGTGWMAGPYLTARIGPQLYFDGRVAAGRSHNDISPFNTYEDAFETNRWMANATISGQFERGNWMVRPEASFTYFEESQEAYRDSLGVAIPGQTVSIGQLKLGPTFAGNFEGDDGVRYSPQFGLNAIYNHGNTSGVTLTDDDAAGVDGWRGRIKAGLTMTTQEGTRVAFGGSYDGLGRDFESWGLDVAVEIPLHKARAR